MTVLSSTSAALVLERTPWQAAGRCQSGAGSRGSWQAVDEPHPSPLPSSERVRAEARQQLPQPQRRVTGWDSTRNTTTAQLEELMDKPWIQPTSQMHIFLEGFGEKEDKTQPSSHAVISVTPAERATLWLKHPLHDACSLLAAQHRAQMSWSHSLALGTSQPPFHHHLRLSLACMNQGVQELIYLGRCYLLGREAREKAARPLPEHSSEILMSGSVQGLNHGKDWVYALPPRLCSSLKANTPGCNSVLSLPSLLA